MLQRGKTGAVMNTDSELYQKRQIQKSQANRLDTLEQNVLQMKKQIETISKLLEVANYAIKSH